MTSVISHIFLVVLLLVGLILTPLGLPGNWLIVACGLGYGFLTEWSKFGWGYIAILAGAALLGEVIELFSASIGARKYGSSRGGEAAALAGSIIGAIIGASLGFLVGALIGAFAGAFAAVFIYEYSRSQDYRQSVRAGVGALLGKTVAVIIKEAIGVIMIVSIVFYFFA